MHSRIPLSSKIIRSRPSVIALGFICGFSVGVADYLTDVEMSLVIFYLIPVSFVTWYAGRKAGILIAAFSTILSLTSDFFLVQYHYSYLAIPFWNAIMRSGVFMIVVFLLSRLKVALVHEKETARIKTNMLSLISHLNAAMTSNLDLHAVGHSLLETIELFFPGCATTIRLLSRETGKVLPFASRSLNEQEWVEELPNSPLAQEVLQTMQPLIVRNVQTDLRTHSMDFFRKNQLVSYLGLPLIARGEVLGIISLYSRYEHEFTKEEIAFFTTLGTQAAVALQNARLFEEVRAGHEQLRDLSRRLLEVREVEHRHIARELHDEIGQVLTGLKLTMEMARRLPPRGANLALQKGESLVDELLVQVHRLSLELRPAMLDDLGLLPTLLWYVERYSSTTALKVNFTQHGLDGQRFTPDIETAAYRIVQEALTNVARHAKVQQVVVQVSCVSNALIIEIQDQGTGFDFEMAIRTGKANGLTGMRERVRLLAGELSIDSTPGVGTSIVAELPLTESNENATRQ
jgi:signal transduction histidine kinase